MRRYFKTNPTVRLINDQNETIRMQARKIRELRYELRSVKARANDQAHLLAVHGIGRHDHSGSGASSDQSAAS
jgi:hypothetical protein